jgi:hypothetical protein
VRAGSAVENIGRHIVSARRRNEPGPEEQAELDREERVDARDEEVELASPDAAEEDDGEESVDEMLEIDQAELEELGLGLDDPHQPDGE